MKSWRTTVCGILGLAASAITLVVIPILDGNANTSADFVSFAAVAAPAIGLLFARDNKVTSEDAGLK